MIPPDDTNVTKVDFTADRDKALLEIKRRHHPRECTHQFGVRVDERDRCVICKACEKAVDPVEAMLDVARHWNRYAENLQHIKRECEEKRDSNNQRHR